MDNLSGTAYTDHVADRDPAGSQGVAPAATGRAEERVAGTAQRVERAAGSLTTRAIARMESSLPWFAALPPDQRATIGLIVQGGILAFARWVRDPASSGAEDVAEAFAAAPPEMARAVPLQRTVEVVRIAVDVVEAAIGELAAPGDEDWLDMTMMRFSREVAFGAAFVYARAAERRGAWDARLEALVVDAILRGDVKVGLLSRAAALGWTGQEQVVVVAGFAPADASDVVLETVQRMAVKARVSVLAGVQGGRLITVLGDCPDPLAAATTMLPAYAPGPVVVGPAVTGLTQAHYSATAALAGLRAAPAWPDTPRPVDADDLLPERALDGDPLARRTLLEQVYQPLLAAGEPVLDTVAIYLETAHSVDIAAKRLFVHPNTVRYRLRRAHAVCGRLATDARDARILQVAIALGRLTDANPPP